MSKKQIVNLKGILWINISLKEDIAAIEIYNFYFNLIFKQNEIQYFT